jgi:hypothetical protein
MRVTALSIVLLFVIFLLVELPKTKHKTNLYHSQINELIDRHIVIDNDTLQIVNYSYKDSTFLLSNHLSVSNKFVSKSTVFK